MTNAEALRDLALTNLVAAEIRASLREPRAAYVKWHYGGAFNGAAWVCADGYFDVLFYPATGASVARVALRASHVAYREGLHPCSMAMEATWYASD